MIESGKLQARGTAAVYLIPEEMRRPDTIPARPWNASISQQPPKRGQPPGLGGTPSAGHCSTAAANASAAASSAMSRSPKRLVRAATTRAHSS